MQDLENSLSTLNTDFLDLWQIHDVRTPEDLRRLEARDRNMTVIGMKCLGGRNYVQADNGLTAEKLIRYALFGTGMVLIIVGCSTPGHVRDLVRAAQQGPLSEDVRAGLESIFSPQAQRLAFYRGGS